MERRGFAKDVLLASLALTAPSFLMGQGNEKKVSPFLRIAMNNDSPQFDFFSIDSLGKNKLDENVILHEEEWMEKKHVGKKAGNKFSYSTLQTGNDKFVWEINIANKSFIHTSTYQQNYSQPFLFNIEQHLNHATLLGMMNGNDNDNAINLPAILHLPDMGTLRVTSTIAGVQINTTAKRFIEHPYVRLEFPAADESNKQIVYSFEVVAIHPTVNGIGNNSRYDCFRKNFISIFQINPF